MLCGENDKDWELKISKWISEKLKWSRSDSKRNDNGGKNKKRRERDNEGSVKRNQVDDSRNEGNDYDDIATGKKSKTRGDGEKKRKRRENKNDKRNDKNELDSSELKRYNYYDDNNVGYKESYEENAVNLGARKNHIQKETGGTSSKVKDGRKKKGRESEEHEEDYEVDDNWAEGNDDKDDSNDESHLVPKNRKHNEKKKKKKNSGLHCFGKVNSIKRAKSSKNMTEASNAKKKMKLKPKRWDNTTLHYDNTSDNSNE